MLLNTCISRIRVSEQGCCSLQPAELRPAPSSTSRLNSAETSLRGSPSSSGTSS